MSADLRFRRRALAGFVIVLACLGISAAYELIEWGAAVALGLATLPQVTVTASGCITSRLGSPTGRRSTLSTSGFATGRAWRSNSGRGRCVKALPSTT